jgi:T5SS/PEP-CTERM-associated repeat protein
VVLRGTAGSELLTQYGSIGHAEGSTGVVTVDNLVWSNASALLIGHSGTGTLTIEAGSAAIAADGRMFLGGATQQFGSRLTNHGHLILTEATTVDGPVTNAAGGAITALDDATFNGLVNGPGGFFGPGTITFAGGLSPGGSPAAVGFAGSVLFGANNTLFMELAGPLLGTEYDHLDIEGDLTLGGTLALILFDDFVPSAGDTFDLFDFTTLNGTFAQIDLNDALLPDGLDWDFDRLYLDGTIAVSAVPLPAGIVLLAPALFVLLGFRRRPERRSPPPRVELAWGQDSIFATSANACATRPSQARAHDGLR